MFRFLRTFSCQYARRNLFNFYMNFSLRYLHIPITSYFIQIKIYLVPTPAVPSSVNVNLYNVILLYYAITTRNTCSDVCARVRYDVDVTISCEQKAINCVLFEQLLLIPKATPTMYSVTVRSRADEVLSSPSVPPRILSVSRRPGITAERRPRPPMAPRCATPCRSITVQLNFT